MFTNKVRCNIIWGGKRKDRVALNINLIYLRLEKGALRACYKKSKVDLNCEIKATSKNYAFFKRGHEQLNNYLSSLVKLCDLKTYLQSVSQIWAS